MKLPFVALSALSLATLSLAACATAPAGEDPRISAPNLSEHIRVLSSDEFEGRGPSTPGEEKTVAYLVQQFQKAGLEPGGPNGAWTQDVPLLKADIDGPLSVGVSVGGQPQAWTQGEQIAVRATMQNRNRVTIRNAPLVFLGYGVEAAERNWDDFKGEDVRGKVGVVLINDPDFENGQGDFGGKAMTYYGRWTYKYEEAAEKGLAGLLIVHETAPASYGWATVKNSNTNTMFDIVRADPAAVHPPLEAWIQREVAVDLFRRAGLDFEALKRQAQTRAFRPVTLPGATFSADYAVKQDRITSKNVLARVPGRSRPAETILYGAHWDHLGVGAPDATGDTIYNGAVDNATGTAAVLELARAFKAGPQPERSVVFAAWTAEEKGLLGSEYYAANPVFPLATTVAGFNVDALEPFGPARDLLVIGYGQSELEDELESTARQMGRVISPDQTPEAGYFYRSDHFPMAKRGVPMLYVDSGTDLLEGGRERGRALAEAYRSARYHQPADAYDPASWNLEGIAQDVQLLYALGYELANSTAWPNYRPTSEFRPERDRSAAARR